MTDYAMTVQLLNQAKDWHKGMHKFPDDAARYSRVLELTSPDVVIECGTQSGNSASWFSRRVAQVVTIDIEPKVPAQLRKVPRIVWITGSSTDSEIQQQVKTLVAGKRVMVSLDSDHSEAHVLAEMRFYSTLVSPGCYMVVEDGIVRQWHGWRGPLDAIETFMVGNMDWTIDTEIEQLSSVTGDPSGWLRKNARSSA